MYIKWTPCEPLHVFWQKAGTGQMGRVEALGHSGQLWHGWPTHSSTRPLRPLHAVPQILAPGCVPDPDAPFQIPRPALRPLPSPLPPPLPPPAPTVLLSARLWCRGLRFSPLRFVPSVCWLNSWGELWTLSRVLLAHFSLSQAARERRRWVTLLTASFLNNAQLCCPNGCAGPRAAHNHMLLRSCDTLFLLHYRFSGGNRAGFTWRCQRVDFADFIGGAAMQFYSRWSWCATVWLDVFVVDAACLRELVMMSCSVHSPQVPHAAVICGSSAIHLHLHEWRASEGSVETFCDLYFVTIHTLASISYSNILCDILELRIRISFLLQGHQVQYLKMSLWEWS